MLAPELIDAVTVVLPLGLMVPLVGESVSQLAVFAAVHTRGPLPVFWTEKVVLAGRNGPPTGPVELKFPPLTTITGVPVTVRPTESAVSPLFEVVFTK